MRTSFPQEIEESGATDTVLTQETPESEAESEKEVNFPKRIKYRGRVLATIYGKSKSYPLYRVAWTVAGKRVMKAFDRYGAAKSHADGLVKDLAKGSQVIALTPGQARDALAALERLQTFYHSTGRRVSLLAGISEYCESAGKLHGRTLGEAVDGFLSTVASVKRKDIKEAVEDFIAAEELRTKASDGQRAQVSGKYHYNRAIMLRRFAGTFPNTTVCDLAKEHLDAFLGSLGELKSKSRNRRAATSAKSRNHHRAAVRQFLQWAVRKDYLPMTHRLLEADTMRQEHANGAEVQFYTATEFGPFPLAEKAPHVFRCCRGLELFANPVWHRPGRLYDSRVVTGFGSGTVWTGRVACHRMMVYGSSGMIIAGHFPLRRLWLKSNLVVPANA